MYVIEDTIMAKRVSVETESWLVPELEGDGAVIPGDSAKDGEDVGDSSEDGDVGDSSEDGEVIGVPADGETAFILSIIYYTS
ncbi:hypothetical protein DY000_02003157 [Brassica cretica]|uniref:Uncharacterized protein n=1 Tax=Brassica cretica TaxID=69181 RepID=A0ABQ7CCK2_BRACR|nr:hypothetical protein DY000_02003157 [Brassica cretica]